MLPDRVSDPGPLTYESCVLPIALRCPAPTVLFGTLAKWHPDDVTLKSNDVIVAIVVTVTLMTSLV